MKKNVFERKFVDFGRYRLGDFNPAYAAYALVPKNIALGAYTPAEFRAGLPSKKLAVIVNTVSGSLTVKKINPSSGGQYVRSVTPVVKLPYTAPRDLNDERIDLADVVFGSNYDLPAGSYSALIVIEVSTDEIEASAPIEFMFDIVGGSNDYDDYSGYDGLDNVSVPGCSASGLSVFGVLALAGLALTKRRRH